MSGSCATGMRSIDSAPASVMTIAMTIASRGRRMKTAEIIGYGWPASGGGLAGPGVTTRPGRTR